jgi:hypothetical protein
MERVVGWVDAESGRSWGSPHGGAGGRPGMTLRPTGMVVFATLESTTPPTRRGQRVAVYPPVAVTTRSAIAPAPQLRRRALRGMAWLLGR